MTGIVLATALTFAWISPAAAAAAATSASTSVAKPPNAVSERAAWLREAKVGLMVHWGLFSVPARARPGESAERILENEDLSIVDYEAFGQALTGAKLDADAWPRLAQESGMGYLVVAAKHRDGFCLWDSTAEPFNSAKFAAAKRDVLKEIGEACRKRGLPLGAAFAAADLRHPEYHLDYAKYVSHARRQMEELVSGYPLAGLWLIGDPKPSWPQAEIIDELRVRKPELMVSDPRRSSPTDPDPGADPFAGSSADSGDFQSFESAMPDTDPFAANPVRVAWEGRYSFGESWGWNQAGEPLVSGERMIDRIVEAASRGGNVLINVGARADGSIPEPLLERLKTIGAWMKVNGESVRGVSPSPFGGPLGSIRTTARGNALYLFLTERPAEPIALHGLKTPIKSAKVLDGGAELAATVQETVARIAAPSRLSELGPTVIKIELDGPPQVDLAFP